MTKPVPESSNDGGRLFDVGETSRTSMLLPTPDTLGDGYAASPRKAANFETNHAVSIGHAIHHLTSSSVDSPASQPAPQADAKAPQMIDGFGLSSPELLASFDPDTCWPRTFQGSLLSMADEPFPRSFETWPRWGTWDRGALYGLRMSARVTVESGSSSLPTPQQNYDGRSSEAWEAAKTRAAAKHQAGEYAKGTGPPGMMDLQRAVMLHTPTTGDTNPSYDHRISPGQKPRARPVPNLAAQVDELLPTPDATHGRKDSRTARLLPGVVDELLPTPQTSDSDRGPDYAKATRDGSGGDDLTTRMARLRGGHTPPLSNDGLE
jgi:hypothetical protein